MIASAQEQRLARRAARGDRQALHFLYEEYSEQLFAVAYRLTESSADAGDLLHDVFCRLPEAIRSFDRTRPLGPWLRAVTTRTALKHLRSQRRRREISMVSTPDELENDGSTELLVLDSITMERALSSLPEELRTVVVLKEMEGYSHKEIGELLQVSRSTSEGRLYKARKLLRAKKFER
ncbi:RNA polymerase sigma factor [Candidatus Palauibacter sp.]|uniref:RNA polymerase sigma factor n=1 Tax=Candidatus Palauibacter sp. TaxID=3101350 RepID=UPI003B5BA8CF